MRDDEPFRYEVTDTGRDAIAAHRAAIADRYVVTADDGWTELWCRLCTGGGDDFIGEWEGAPNENAAAILRVRRQHETDHHQGGDTPCSP